MTATDSPADPLHLDLRGLNCPLPVLKTAKAMKNLAPGARVVVVATDPLASVDIPNFCREHGHTLIDSAREGDELHFTLAKGAPA